MKKLSILIFVTILLSCNKNNNDLTVKATIKGLKKGVVYLKKIQDTALVTVDSVIVNGNSNFELYSTIESPEIFYLELNKNSKEEDRISFFADYGVTEINTTLKNFVYDAKIKGSEQQKVLESYKTFISKVNNRNLDIIKEKFEAQIAKDTLTYQALINEEKGALKRKYLYTVNFALQNKDSEVAPYLALSEIYNARLDLLDTINKALTPKVRASKYGKELNSFIEKIKELE